jgi:dCMP deaminase
VRLVVGRPAVKICSMCGVRKPLSDFYRDSSSKDGYRGNCKTCHMRGGRRYRDPELNAEYMRNYRAKLASGERPSWYDTWGRLALDMALRSRCDRAKIGAVIVSPDNQVVATGYNGPPARYDKATTDHCLDWCERGKQGPTDLPAEMLYDDCPANHAEMNALTHSSWREQQGGVIYVTGSVCMTCAKAIANSGIAFVALVNVDEEADAHRHPEKVRAFLEECGVIIWEVKIDV